MKPGELIYIASELLSGICGTERDALTGALSFPVMKQATVVRFLDRQKRRMASDCRARRRNFAGGWRLKRLARDCLLTTQSETREYLRRCTSRDQQSGRFSSISADASCKLTTEIGGRPIRNGRFPFCWIASGLPLIQSLNAAISQFHWDILGD
jgi:hypothetical protein